MYFYIIVGLFILTVERECSFCIPIKTVCLKGNETKEDVTYDNNLLQILNILLVNLKIIV